MKRIIWKSENFWKFMIVSFSHDKSHMYCKNLKFDEIYKILWSHTCITGIHPYTHTVHTESLPVWCWRRCDSALLVTVVCLWGELSEMLQTWHYWNTLRNKQKTYYSVCTIRTCTCKWIHAHMQSSFRRGGLLVPLGFSLLPLRIWLLYEFYKVDTELYVQ